MPDPSTRRRELFPGKGTASVVGYRLRIVMPRVREGHERLFRSCWLLGRCVLLAGGDVSLIYERAGDVKVGFPLSPRVRERIKGGERDG